MKNRDQKPQRAKIADPEQPASLLNQYGHSIGEGRKATEGRAAINRGWGEVKAPEGRTASFRRRKRD